MTAIPTKLRSAAAVAAFAIGISTASSAFAMGAGYVWPDRPSTYEKPVVAKVVAPADRVIAATHPNALWQYRPDKAGTVIRRDRSPVFAGHPNTYFLSRTAPRGGESYLAEAR